MKGKFKYLNIVKSEIGAIYSIIYSFNLFFIMIIVLFFCFNVVCFGNDYGRYVVVEKSRREVRLYEDGRMVGVFPCSLGLGAESPKRSRGDFATPEGLYFVREKHPSRKYYLFVELDYPALKDILRAHWEGRLSDPLFSQYLRAWSDGRIIRGPLGYAVGLHGGGLVRKEGNKILRDWTHGCIALRNADMQRLYRFVRKGTPVLIYNRRRPLVETLAEVVPLVFSPEGWQGRLSLSFPEMNLSLDILVTGRRDGLRTLEIAGTNLSDGRPLFYVRDLNGNGRLDPLDTLYSDLQGFPGGYPALQRFILDELPRKVLNLVQENRRGWRMVNGGHPARKGDAEPVRGTSPGRKTAGVRAHHGILP